MDNEETKKLIDAIKNPQQNFSSKERESVDMLYDIMTDFSNIEKFKQKESNRLINSIVKKQLLSSRIMRFAVMPAAVAIIVISFLIWNNYEFLLTKKTTVASNLTRERVAPTLILSNGVKINLSDDFPISINEEATSTITKVSDSQLNYNADLSINTPVNTHYLVIPKGYTYSVTLPDGSLVMMNSNSELSYPSRFEEENRTVHLKGEAYFNVKKGTTPFIVRTDKLSVRVYGTTFNINTQKTDLIETTLLEGSIGVTLYNSPTDSIMIKPNEQFTLNTRTQKSVLSSVIGDDYAAWTLGKFKCHREPLEYLLIKISNWYKITFTYKDEYLKSYKINAILHNNSTIDELLQAIETTINVKFINEGGGEYTVIGK